MSKASSKTAVLSTLIEEIKTLKSQVAEDREWLLTVCRPTLAQMKKLMTWIKTSIGPNLEMVDQMIGDRISQASSLASPATPAPDTDAIDQMVTERLVDSERRLQRVLSVLLDERVSEEVGRHLLHYKKTGKLAPPAKYHPPPNPPPSSAPPNHTNHTQKHAAPQPPSPAAPKKNAQPAQKTEAKPKPVAASPPLPRQPRPLSGNMTEEEERLHRQSLSAVDQRQFDKLQARKLEEEKHRLAEENKKKQQEAERQRRAAERQRAAEQEKREAELQKRELELQREKREIEQQQQQQQQQQQLQREKREAEQLREKRTAPSFAKEKRDAEPRERRDGDPLSAPHEDKPARHALSSSRSPHLSRRHAQEPAEDDDPLAAAAEQQEAESAAPMDKAALERERRAEEALSRTKAQQAKQQQQGGAAPVPPKDPLAALRARRQPGGGAGSVGGGVPTNPTQFLAQLGMSRYLNRFTEKEYDNMQIIRQMTTEDLEYLEITDASEQERILGFIAQLPPASQTPTKAPSGPRPRSQELPPASPAVQTTSSQAKSSQPGQLFDDDLFNW